MVHSIEVDGTGRPAGALYFDQHGAEQRLRAAIVVVACSAVESARLLLHSRSPAHPNGLGNESGLIGRNLMFASFGTGAAEFSRTEPRMAAIDWRQPFVNRSFQDLYFIGKDGSKSRKGGTVSFLFPHANPIFTAERLATEGREPVWGAALKQALRRVSREVRELEFEVFSETLPVADSQVSLDPQVKDRWGMPAARLTMRRHRLDAETNGILVEKGLEVLRAMGGQQVRATRSGSQMYVVQGGTCRFGDDPRTSVLDRDCRSRSAPNLFVADGSLMPTLGGVPNPLTIEANALRVAERIVALGRAHELRRAWRT